MDNKLINQQIRKISNSSSAIVLAFVIFLNIIQLIIIFLTKANIISKISDDVLNLIVYCILYLIAIPTILLIFYKTRGKRVGLKLKPIFCKPKMPTKWILKWIVIGYAGLYIANFISTIFFKLLEIITKTELYSADLNFGISTIGIITTFVALPIFAPIFEELMFRGTIYRNTEPMGQLFSMIFTGLMFGLWHENYPQFLYAATMGVVASFLFAKTRSIFPAIILHFIINTISAIEYICINLFDADLLILKDTGMPNIPYISQHIIPISIVSFFACMSMAIMIIGLILFIIELVDKRKMLKLYKSKFEIPTSKKILVFFTAPVTLVTIFTTITFTIMNALR